VPNVETAIYPTTTAARRPNRILLALAAVWMIVSLAIGGTVAADSGTGQAPETRAAAENAAQP
jgi:hypothetical protein